MKSRETANLRFHDFTISRSHDFYFAISRPRYFAKSLAVLRHRVVPMSVVVSVMTVVAMSAVVTMVSTMPSMSRHLIRRVLSSGALSMAANGSLHGVVEALRGLLGPRADLLLSFANAFADVLFPFRLVLVLRHSGNTDDKQCQ